MNTAKVNSAYELYQIITDFDNPIQIFIEAFQNSYDESATKIFCRIHKKINLGKETLLIKINIKRRLSKKTDNECF